MERSASTLGIQPEHETSSRVKKPQLYKVLLLNDDYTTMDFVVFILEHIFGKSTLEATSIMLQVHNNGRGVVGLYTFEIAETKVQEVISAAKKNGFPLKCVMEPE